MNTPQIQEIATLDPNAVFSVGEVARLLGLTHNGILGRIKSGAIKAGRSGHRYFVPGSEIQGQIVMPGEIKKPKAAVQPTVANL